MLARPRVDARGRRPDARPPRRLHLPPPPRRPVDLARGRARGRRVRRPGVRAARLGRRLRRPEGRGGARQPRRRARDRRERLARPRRARAPRGAGRLGGGAGQARAGRGGAARPRDRPRGPLRARRRPQPRLEGRPLLLRRRDVRGRLRRRARARAAAARAHARRDGRRRRAGAGAGRRPGLRGHRAGRAARLPDPLPALAVRVPRRRGGAAAARGRRRHDHDLVPRDAVRQRRDRADVDLRAEPHHRARPRPRDRLLAVHGLALPRGARARARHGRGAARDDEHGGADRAVLVDHRGGGARRAARVPAALPLLDGRRRDDLRARRRARVADAAAGHPGRARPARERAQPEALAGRAAPRGLRRARRLLVPPVADA